MQDRFGNRQKQKKQNTRIRVSYKRGADSLFTRTWEAITRTWLWGVGIAPEVNITFSCVPENPKKLISELPINLADRIMFPFIYH